MISSLRYTVTGEASRDYARIFPGKTQTLHDMVLATWWNRVARDLHFVLPEYGKSKWRAPAAFGRAYLLVEYTRNGVIVYGVAPQTNARKRRQ